MKDRIFTIIYGISIFGFLLAVSIAFPILFRPFYYLQINPVIIPIGQASGYWNEAWTYETIKEGYDEVLDFCCYPWVNEFSAGIFKFTEEGAAHFADCKVLFFLDFWVLGISAALMVTLKILEKKHIYSVKKLFNRGPWFYASVLSVAIPLVILILVLIAGFDQAFETFHAIFFPGKDNWIFYIDADEIINVMPEQFFMNCAISIAVVLVLLAALGIVSDFIHRKKLQ